MYPLEWDLPAVPPVENGEVTYPSVALSEDKQQLVQKLSKYIREEKLPETTDAELVKYVHCVDYDLRKAEKCVKDFYTARNDCKELFSGWDAQLPEVKKILQYMNIAVLPRLTPDGCRILMFCPRENALSVYGAADLFKAIFMVMESVFISEPTVTGMVLVHDMRNVTIYQLIKAMFSLLPKVKLYLEDGIPIKRNIIHLVNAPRLIDYAIRVISSIGREEDHEKVRPHRGVDNFIDLYKEIPRECLPSDLGGSLPSLSTLNDMTISRLQEFGDIFRIRQLI